jgi:hypothetical protein
MTAITERVERGAALLDERRPDWWREIDLDRLALKSPCNCVLGQIGERQYGPSTYSLGRYSDGLDLMGLRPLDGRDYGFDMDIDPDAFTDWKEGEAAVKRDFDALTAAWRGLITKRRESAAVTA